VVIPNVVEDAPDEVDRQATRPPLVWMAVGLIIGAGLAVILLQGTGQPPVTTSAVVETSVTSSRGGITEVLPDFPDGLIAVSRSDGQSLELLVWPLMGEPYERGIPVGASSPPDPVTFDVSGQLLATVVPVRGESAGVLYAGVPDTAAIVALDVVGYAWHDAEPRALAYTTLGDGDTLLWDTLGNLTDSQLIAQVAGIAGSVAAWGYWGFAIQDGDNVILSSVSGDLAEIGGGRILDSHKNGWIAVDDEGLKLLNPNGEVREIPSVGAEGPMIGASFSPDGTRLGVLTEQGLKVASLGGDEIGEALERPGVPQVVWSSDSRFALFPGTRGVIVLDTDDGEVHELLSTGIFTGLAVLDIDQS
jgi:hypothetical protein